MGVSGLVVVALFAAAMSSVDSGVNAVTAVVLTDFIRPFRKTVPEPRQELKLSRILTVAIGVVIVLLNNYIDHVPGNYTAVTNKTVNLLVGPLFMLFVFALFVPSATSFGAIWGSIYGSAAAVFVGGWDMLTGLDPLSFQWSTPVSLIVNGIVGWGLSQVSNERWSPRLWLGASVIVAVPIVVAVSLIVF